MKVPRFKLERQTNSHIFCTAVTTAIIGFAGFFSTTQSAIAAAGPYCQFIPEEVEQKEKLLNASLANEQSAPEYDAIVQRHREMLQLCRSQTWPQEQAIWLRLYPCDISPGSIDHVLDRIVNLGYSKIHLEVFYDSQVLLPPGDNSTPWTSVVRSPEAENIDLLQQAIDKSHQRGLKVYAWLFTMNFGYTYAQRADRQEALARNGTGQDSLTYVHDRAQAFIDPYSPQAQTDYYNLVQAVLKRQPDGILFDYVRYPRGIGGQSSVNSVKDLWIYGKSSLSALFNRASNKKGLALLQKYIDTGDLTTQDLEIADQRYPEDSFAQWQGRSTPLDAKATLSSRHNQLKQDLWFFSVAHAAQGVIDFLAFAAKPAQNLGLPAGTVFFPDANRLVGGQGFDSRLQAWDQFPTDLEWHPMAYADCGLASCIVDEVKRVLNNSPAGVKVQPALAGSWGQSYGNRPSLEVQMVALQSTSAQVQTVSHFAYSWQQPQNDANRKACRL